MEKSKEPWVLYGGPARKLICAEAAKSIREIARMRCWSKDADRGAFLVVPERNPQCSRSQPNRRASSWLRSNRPMLA